jgi:muconolactone delta-isomerase
MRNTMDFLVEFAIGVPPDYDPKLLEDLLKRERARAAEIAAAGNFFKHVWIVPCQAARISICSARDAAELHATFTSLPAAKWNSYQVTPLIECASGAPICIPD